MKLILLGILKGIGIVLLALLLLFLLLVLVVLFSPIRYQLAGEKKAELGGSFGVSWLCGTVKIDGGYTPAESLKCKVKVLWFTLIGGEPKEKKEKKPKKKKAPKKEALKPDLQAAEKTTKQAEKTVQEETAPLEAEKKEEPPITEKITEKEETPLEQPKVKQQRMERKQPKTVRRVKLSEVEEKPPTEDMDIQLELDEDDAFFTGDEAQEATKGKIPPIVKELWSIEEKKEIFKALKKLLKRLMKGILPGNLFLKGTIGTGDPTTTGYVLALAGMLTAKFGNDIQIKGDFTKATAEDMEVRVKGKIVLGKLLWAVLAFVLTKPVRKAIRKTIKFLRKKD